MRAKVLFRMILNNEHLPKINANDDKIIRRIEIERKALISHQLQAHKENKIQPMIHIIEKIQESLKNNEATPCEKLEKSLELKPGASYDSFMKDFSMKFGSFSMDLYGTEKDLRIESIARRGEIVPQNVKSEDAMILYRKYYITNYSLPGLIENINPNKFLRLKPKEEFPLLPIIPISPMTLKRWEEDLQIKKKEGYRFKIDKGRLYTGALTIATFITFIILIYFLYKKDEESWVQIDKARKKRSNKEIGLY